MANDYTWTQQLEVIIFAEVKPFLVNLAKSNNCKCRIIKDNSTFWKDKLTIEFEGKIENLKKLREEFILAVTKFNLPSNVVTANYEIQAIEEKESGYSREILFTVNSSKSSKIKELVEAVADEVLVGYEVSEKSNGFLKGKTVHISTMGDEDKLQKFKAIFLSVIHDSLLKQQKSKLRM